MNDCSDKLLHRNFDWVKGPPKGSKITTAMLDEYKYCVNNPSLYQRTSGGFKLLRPIPESERGPPKRALTASEKTAFKKWKAKFYSEDGMLPYYAAAANADGNTIQSPDVYRYTYEGVPLHSFVPKAVFFKLKNYVHSMIPFADLLTIEFRQNSKYRTNRKLDAPKVVKDTKVEDVKPVFTPSLKGGYSLTSSEDGKEIVVPLQNGKMHTAFITSESSHESVSEEPYQPTSPRYTSVSGEDQPAPVAADWFQSIPPSVKKVTELLALIPDGVPKFATEFDQLVMLYERIRSGCWDAKRSEACRLNHFTDLYEKYGVLVFHAVNAYDVYEHAVENLLINHGANGVEIGWVHSYMHKFTVTKIGDYGKVNKLVAEIPKPTHTDKLFRILISHALAVINDSTDKGGDWSALEPCATPFSMTIPEMQHAINSNVRYETIPWKVAEEMHKTENYDIDWYAGAIPTSTMKNFFNCCISHFNKAHPLMTDEFADHACKSCNKSFFNEGDLCTACLSKTIEKPAEYMEKKEIVNSLKEKGLSTKTAKSAANSVTQAINVAETTVKTMIQEGINTIKANPPVPVVTGSNVAFDFGVDNTTTTVTTSIVPPPKPITKIEVKNTAPVLCTRCMVRPQNGKYKWCQECYTESTKPGSLCTSCKTTPANPGRAWCEACYVNKVFVSKANTDNKPAVPTESPQVEEKLPERVTDGELAQALVDKITLPPKTNCDSRNLVAEMPEDFEFVTALGRGFDTAVQSFQNNLDIPFKLLKVVVLLLLALSSFVGSHWVSLLYNDAFNARDPLWRVPLVYIGILNSRSAPFIELFGLWAATWGLTVCGVLFSIYCCYSTFNLAFNMIYWVYFRIALYRSMSGNPYKYEVRYKAFVKDDLLFDARSDMHRQGEVRHSNPQLCHVDLITTSVNATSNDYVLTSNKSSLIVSVSLLNQLSSLKTFTRTGDLTTAYKAIELAVKNSSSVNIPQSYLSKLKFIHSDTVLVAQLMLSYLRDGEVPCTLGPGEGAAK